MMRHQIFSVPEALPEGKRHAALDLQVRKAFPFREPAFFAVWNGTDASVYAWDEAKVDAALEATNVKRNVQIVPETVIRERGTNEIRLVAMLEGYEGQYWVNGFLKASRWWPTLPSAFDWSKFVRSLGTSFDASPTPVEFPFLERPWTEGTFSLDDWSVALQNKRVLTAAAVAALCPFVLFGSSAAFLSIKEGAIRSELAALDEANRAIRKDRADAYSNLDAIETLLALNEYPPQAEVLARAIAILMESGSSKIVSWSYDRGNVELIARADHDLDPTAYITVFERDALFENASGTLVGPERDLQLRMAVSKRALN